MDRLIRHYLVLLDSACRQPDTCIDRLELLTEPERRQLLIEWNDTQRDYPSDRCVHQLFEDQVDRTPDAVAVVFEEVGEEGEAG